MKIVCEIIVQRVLPGLRAVISKELMTTYGMNQTEISEKLGTTQPAISQYLRHLRGENLKIFQDADIEWRIKTLCKKIKQNETDAKIVSDEICELCNLIIKKGMLKSIGHVKCGIRRG